MRYEINQETSAISIFDENDVEVLYQPTWPDGTAWASVAEAEAWVTQHLLSLDDITADLAGPSPDKPTVTRPPVVAPPTVPGTE
jgi:hypothetical protein